MSNQQTPTDRIPLRLLVLCSMVGLALFLVVSVVAGQLDAMQVIAGVMGVAAVIAWVSFVGRATYAWRQAQRNDLLKQGPPSPVADGPPRAIADQYFMSVRLAMASVAMTVLLIFGGLAAATGNWYYLAIAGGVMAGGIAFMTILWRFSRGGSGRWEMRW